MRPSLSSVALIALMAWASTASPPAAAAPVPRRSTRQTFRLVYDPPKNPQHQAIYERVMEQKLLERFAGVLAALRLPRTLTLKTAGCDGTSNAWYEPADGTVTFCYEYMAEIEGAAAGAEAHGIPSRQAADGAIVFVLLHETSHAVFDLLKIPILGREEDAADHVAALTLLRAGEGLARRVLAGAAWMYLHDAKGKLPDESDFADVHGLDAQRFYNVLCIAYGSNPESFSGMVKKGYLPQDRADECADEFHQVAYAVQKLMSQNVDAAVWARTKAAHKARWEAPDKRAQPTSDAEAK